jgi:hypothetical protein
MKHDSRKREIIFCSDVRMDPPAPEEPILYLEEYQENTSKTGGTIDPSEIAEEMIAQAMGQQSRRQMFRFEVQDAVRSG